MMEYKDFDKRKNTTKENTTMVDFDYEKYAEVEYKATHTDAVAALTCGILAIVFAVFYLPLGVVASIVGIVFGIRGCRRNPRKCGMAIAGLICSIIGIIIAAAMVVLALTLIGGVELL